MKDVIEKAGYMFTSLTPGWACKDMSCGTVIAEHRELGECIKLAADRLGIE